MSNEYIWRREKEREERRAEKGREQRGRGEEGKKLRLEIWKIQTYGIQKKIEKERGKKTKKHEIGISGNAKKEFQKGQHWQKC